MNLGDFLFLGKGMHLHTVVPPNMLADVYESVVGAIYLDGGLEAARCFILRHLGPEIEQVAEGAARQLQIALATGGPAGAGSHAAIRGSSPWIAAAYRHSVPTTVHVGIGYDIIHEHPNCDGQALGGASYRDFLIFTKTMEKLEGGVMLNIGSAIMGPEVYLKALSMVRNVAQQHGRVIRKFTTAVFDLVPIQGDIHHELPKTDPGYYFRCHKTILVRTVADGGESFYFRGDHRATVPALRHALLNAQP